MFFILSKVLAFLLMPLTWVTILLFLSLFAVNPRKKKKYLIACITIFLFFSNPFICDEFIRSWETSVKTGLEKGEYDAAIVLSGGMITIDTDYDRMTFRDNTDRIMQAVHLYHQGFIKKIIISGGSGSLVYQDMREAPLMKRFLSETCVPAEDILIDSTSDNTHQNAVNTAILLRDSLPGAHCLLITSSIHMKRANACFVKQGICAEPYPSNKLTGRRRWDPAQLLLPDIRAFAQWNQLIHEVSGYMIYTFMDYI